MIKTALSFWCTTLCAVGICNADSTDAFVAENAEISMQQMNPPAPQKESCGKAPRHMRASARYTSPKGIGYKQGYTTVEALFAPRDLLRNAWLPFVDLRGHVFDNGKLAANAGVGLRYLCSNRIWGVNSYYDYRNTNHQHYNQVSAGLETLGRIWDFRLNGYLPVGWKQSPLYHTQFGGFRGNELLLRRSKGFALKGANAEAGFHLDHFHNAPLYFAAGPYYLTGKEASAWGGQLRASVELLNRYIRIEGNVGYDHFFKWTGQGQFSVNIPFGKRSKVRTRKGNTCGQAMTLANRMMQPVDRHEIIPVGKKHIYSPAIDPATGLPYLFVFVNNTSHSLGTFESPYPTLAEAQANSAPGNVIYVYPGDGTSTGMNTGITLQDGQLLFGSATPQTLSTTLGTITIAAQSSVMPNITNIAGDVVTLASNNTVSGFNIQGSAGNGISGTGITNLTAAQNILGVSSSYSGIFLTNPSGQVNINSNTFTASEYGIQLALSSGTLDSININNCSFPGTDYGIYPDITGGTIGTFNVSNSSFSRGDYGFYMDYSAGTIENLTISNSTFVINDEAIYLSASGGTIENLTINNNTFYGQTGIYATLADLTSDTVDISENNFIGCYDAIEFYPSGGTYDTLNFSKNTFTANQFGIYYETGTSPIVENFNVTNNIHNWITENAFSYVAGTTNPVFMEVSGNSYTSGSIGTTGYAAFIEILQGTTCLEFINNNASPTSTPVPYSFTQSGSVFNLTPGSDNTTNTGTFMQIGTFGTCSE